MDDLMLWGVPAVALIAALVQLCRFLGMPVDFAPWLTGALSAGVAAVMGLYRVFPDAAPWFDLFGVAVLLWLASTGIYHKAKDVGEGVRKHEQEP